MTESSFEYLPPEITAALEEPVMVDPIRRAAKIDDIMGSVRSLPIPAECSMPPSLMTKRRRGILLPVGILALAVMALSGGVAVSLTGAMHKSSVMLARAEVLADTVVPRSLENSIHDTLRIVGFVLRAPLASKVSLVSDYNDQVVVDSPSLEPETGLWKVRVVLPTGSSEEDVSRFSFLVDDRHSVPVRLLHAASSVNVAGPVTADTVL